MKLNEAIMTLIDSSLTGINSPPPSRSEKFEYPKFPKLEHHDIERSGVAVAFDGFAVPLEAEGDELSTLTQFVRDFFHS